MKVYIIMYESTEYKKNIYLLTCKIFINTRFINTRFINILHVFSIKYHVCSGK